MTDLSSLVGIFLAILLLTSFIKIVTCLTIFRLGIGLNQSGFGFVVIAVSLALSFMVMHPQISSMGGINALFNSKFANKDLDIEKNFTPFLEKNSDPQLKARLSTFVQSTDKQNEEKAQVKPAKDEKNAIKESSFDNSKQDNNFGLVLVSFLLTELKEAFQIGLLILIPFLVIDLLVANSLILLGATQFNPEIIAVPLKLALFFAVDGWALLAEKILRTYL